MYLTCTDTKVESLQRAALKSPVRVSISTKSHQLVKTLLQSFVLVPHKHKVSCYMAYSLIIVDAKRTCTSSTCSTTTSESPQYSLPGPSTKPNESPSSSAPSASKLSPFMANSPNLTASAPSTNSNQKPATYSSPPTSQPAVSTSHPSTSSSISTSPRTATPMFIASAVPLVPANLARQLVS